MQTHSYRNNFQYPDDAQWRIGSGQNYDLIQQGQNRPTVRELYREYYNHQIPMTNSIYPHQPALQNFHPPQRDLHALRTTNSFEFIGGGNHAPYPQPTQLWHRNQTNTLWSDFSDPQTSTALEITQIDRSAIRCSISWMWKPPPSVAYDKHNVRIEIMPKKTGKIDRFIKNLPMSITKFVFKTEPGCRYDVTLEIYNSTGHLVAQKYQEIRAIFSLLEIGKLMTRAINFTGDLMQPFSLLYRCKPKCYWDYTYFQGSEILEVYQKDHNGQAASPINDKIKGLFFSARTLSDGTLPPSSPFGEIRMIIPALTLLDPRRVNFYFSDFYCNTKPHYVTIVVCAKGSDPDCFCKDNLLELTPGKNEFLRIEPTASPDVPFRFSANRRVWVEVFYTENVPMKWGRFDRIQTIGVGTSKIGGLPHNKSCTTCNLYPTAHQMNDFSVEEIDDSFTDEPFLENNENHSKSPSTEDDLASATSVETKIEPSKQTNQKFEGKTELLNELEGVTKETAIFSTLENISTQAMTLGQRINLISKRFTEFIKEMDDDFAVQNYRIDQCNETLQEAIDINNSGLYSQRVEAGEDFASFLETDTGYSSPFSSFNSCDEVRQVLDGIVDSVVGKS